MSDGIRVGQPVEDEAQAPITRELLRAFAEAAGDPNPIHLDEQAARRAGLPGIIAHGMLVAGFVAERARRFADGAGCPGWELRSFQTRFKAMTALGETISVGGKVESVSEAELVLELHARSSSGEIKATGRAHLRRLH